MKLLVANLTFLLAAALFPLPAAAQDATTSKPNEGQLEILTRKIDEQNAKIDALSQQLLKLEQQISNMRPGVMIGEATPIPTAAPVTGASPAATSAGNAHVVAKGETLTSIAKSYKVGVQDLQKFNHIENDRALQIGQTIMIPIPGSASPSAPAASPNQ